MIPGSYVASKFIVWAMVRVNWFAICKEALKRNYSFIVFIYQDEW